MKLWKKIFLILLAVLILAQIPFVYRRYQKGKLTEKIANLDAQKKVLVNQKFNDFKGVIHVHTSLGGHSTGTFDELIGAAQKNNLDFVVMTEHTAELYDTAAMTLQDARAGVLFVGGNEVNTKSDERFLILNGFAGASASRQFDTPEFLQKVRAENKLAFIAYPEKFSSWNSDFDGIEVFNLFTNAKQSSAAYFLLDALWSYPAYPELTLAEYFKRPGDNLQRFDEVAANKKTALFAGSDAHSNIGAHLAGDDSGHKFINLKFDAYETIFRLVRTHVLLEKDKSLTQANLLAALKNGRTFIGFDCLSETAGFSFTAENARETKTLGDEISLADDLDLKIAAPQIARFVIFKNGEKIFDQGGSSEINFRVHEKGAYRTELYLDSLGAPYDAMPWIISNPIYVK